MSALAAKQQVYFLTSVSTDVPLSFLVSTEKFEPPSIVKYTLRMASVKHASQNGIVQPLLTDWYQITMAYAYWKSGKTSNRAVFDLFFRKSPFSGEFTVFAGLSECVAFLQNFQFSDSDIEYLKERFPGHVDHRFYDYLKTVNANDVSLYSIPEGSIVFPKVPLMRLEGPLPVVQLLETTLLNLVNFASLVATNAARFRIAAGTDKKLLEFGLRRAQGPDGALSASRYCYLGGFDGTSNVLAGKKFGIPLRGTQAHSFVSSFLQVEEHLVGTLTNAKSGQSTEQNFFPVCKKWLKIISSKLGVLEEETNDGELIGFAAFAVAFPTNFLALLDTYDVSKSGLPNFIAVALALNEFGYKPTGVRIDSGDLAYLSKFIRSKFRQMATELKEDFFNHLMIVASNDINEETLYSLKQQGHEIDSFGIGTHLVTCQKQPALGCVYKLVEIDGKPRIKISEEVNKVTIPGKKTVYRLYGNDGKALIDLIQKVDEAPPEEGKRVLCRHPNFESKRAYVIPHRVEQLLKLYYEKGQIREVLPPLAEIRQNVLTSLQALREDHLRPLNPTPYKVSLSDSLYNFMHDLWLESAPIGELS